EHAAVIVYYNVDNGLGQPVVDRLTQLVPTLQNTFLIPYPTLPPNEGLALAAWNQLQTCPPNLTPTQAATIVTGFSTAFACTSNAPEPKSSGSCEHGSGRHDVARVAGGTDDATVLEHRTFAGAGARQYASRRESQRPCRSTGAEIGREDRAPEP